MVKQRMSRGDITSGEWIETLENALVHRSRVVEARLVQDAKHRKRLAEYV